MEKEMLFFELKNFQFHDLPLAAWLESPYMLYQRPHAHDCFEMVLIVSGTGWCAVNDLRFPMLKGDLYIMRPGDRHEFSGNPGLKFYNMMFSEALFTPEEDEVLRPLLSDSGKYIVPSAACERVETLLADLTGETKNSLPGNLVAARAIFLRFMVELLRYRDVRFTVSAGIRESRLLARMFGFINRHCCEKLKLSDLGRETGCSPEYAGRLFKRLTGITFSDYLIRYRIDLACGKLENSHASISEIAAEMGYFDTAYFDKCFRKILGMSPVEYRRRLASGHPDGRRSGS